MFRWLHRPPKVDYLEVSAKWVENTPLDTLETMHELLQEARSATIAAYNKAAKGKK